jgi:aryl-phospho-beta-D-glucosidase BglC (GH1 family)
MKTFKFYFIVRRSLFLIAFFSFQIASFAQTPVSVNGALKVSGNRILNQNNQTVSFSGPSHFWSNTGWGGERFYNSGTLNYFRTNWNAGIIRAAMGVEDGGGYLSDPANKTRVKTVVDAAISAGMYVIIDWHSHRAENYQQSAVDFFKEMAQTYGTKANVIYEIYNEPLQISWSGVIKPYAQAVIQAIRAIDPDNLIVVGTPTWSQDVDVAANDPITGYINIAYSLHFYAATHKQALRDKATYALSKGIALFVTEWGTCEASGSGFVDQVSTNEWVNFMKANSISNCNWSINDKAESASILNPGVSSSTGAWTDADLTASGKIVKNIVLNWGGGGSGGGSTSSNLALNKLTSVSSTESTSYPGANAVDGNTGTRWSSAFSDPQWIYVDLGAANSISRVKITWEAAYGKDYTIQTSADATSWTTIKTVTGNTTLVNDNTGLSGSGRYVRIYGTARGTPYGYSIYELEVYGTSSSTSSNLLTNPGFENGLTPWTGNSCTITQDAGQKQSGSYSVKASARAAAWAGPVQNIKNVLATNGTGTYTLSAWMKKETTSTTGKITVMLKYGGVSYYFGVSAGINSTGWTQVTGPLNLSWTGTLEDATFYLETVSNQENFFADNCSLIKGTSPTIARLTNDLSMSVSDPSATVQIYPNPASGEINVFLGEFWKKDSELRILSISGKELIVKKINSSRQKIDLRGQPSGIYILQVNNKNQRIMQKIVKK